ncbi:hypothetical protein OAF54_03380 [bacterium]|nr:hypothetical protein [bacterium]
MIVIYDSIEVKIWKDLWFKALDKNHKLAWIYLLANEGSNYLGAYQLSIGEMSDYIGCSARKTRDIIRTFCEAGKCSFDAQNSVIWVTKRFSSRSQNGADVSPTVLKNAQESAKEIKESPLFKQILSAYPILKKDPKVYADELRYKKKSKLKETKSSNNTPSPTSESFHSDSEEPIPSGATAMPDRVNQIQEAAQRKMSTGTVENVAGFPCPDSPADEWESVDLWGLKSEANIRGMSEAQTAHLDAIVSCDDETQAMALRLLITWIDARAKTVEPDQAWKSGILGDKFKECVARVPKLKGNAEELARQKRIADRFQEDIDAGEKIADVVFKRGEDAEAYWRKWKNAD